MLHTSWLMQHGTWLMQHAIWLLLHTPEPIPWLLLHGRVFRGRLAGMKKEPMKGSRGGAIARTECP